MAVSIKTKLVLNGSKKKYGGKTFIIVLSAFCPDFLLEGVASQVNSEILTVCNLFRKEKLQENRSKSVEKFSTSVPQRVTENLFAHLASE
jgi:hypothetical protein